MGGERCGCVGVVVCGRCGWGVGGERCGCVGVVGVVESDSSTSTGVLRGLAAPVAHLVQHLVSAAQWSCSHLSQQIPATSPDDAAQEDHRDKLSQRVPTLGPFPLSM